MTVTIDRDALLEAVKTVEAAVRIGTVGSSPSHGYLLLDPERKTLAGGENVFAEATVPTVSGDEPLAFHATVAKDLLRHLSGTVTLTSTDTGVKWRAKGAKSTRSVTTNTPTGIADHVRAHYADLLGQNVEQTITIDAALAAYVTATTLFASQDVARGVLQAVRFDGTLIAATDSYRAHLVTTDTKFPPISFPAKLWQTIRRHVADGATIGTTSTGTVVVTGKDLRCWSPHISDDYPNISLFARDDDDHTVVVDSSELEEATRIASLFTDDKKIATIQVTLRDSTIQVANSQTENGEATTFVDAAYIGPDLTIYFNANYLAEALKQYKGDVTIGFNTGTGGKVSEAVRFMQPGNPACHYLMPILR